MHLYIFSGLWITCIIYNVSAIKVVVMLDYLDNSDKRKGLTPSLQMHFFQFIFNMKWVELHIEFYRSCGLTLVIDIVS